MSCVLYLGTGNPYKVREIASLLTPLGWDIQPLSSLDVDETEQTFEANALLKAKAYAKHSRGLTLAEDTGVSVAALDGWPGVWSARFSQHLISTGEFANVLELGTTREEIDRMNNEALLHVMRGKVDRSAVLTVSLVVVDSEGELLCQATESLEGEIAMEARGEHGFGYDPVFIARNSYGCTLAEIDSARKNLCSPRKKVLDTIYDWAENYY